MGDRTGTQKTPITTIEIPAFIGGINTSVNGREIKNEEARSIQNFEFDDSSDLVTRNGFSTDGTGRSSLIGSTYVFSTESAFIGILYNYSNNLVSRPLVLGSETALGTFANAGTGRWYWKQLANVAVAATNGDTIQVVGGAPGTASVLAAAPDSRYIEEWESRLFLVHSASPNRVQCSDLGSATSWNTGGLTNPAQGIIFDVAAGDGDIITALFAFKERLFIFKRRRIYVLRTTALPITDPNNWEVAEYSKNIGCVNQTTVREVFDDVLFLAEGGVCSLSAAEGTADFASALMSQKIEDLQRINQNATELDIFGFTLHDKSQYWLACQTGAGATAGQVTFVLDYRKVKEGIPPRWVKFSRLVPTAMDAYNISQNKIVYVLGDNAGGSNNRIGKYTANLLPANRIYKDILNGSDTAINCSLITKNFDFGSFRLRKLFKEWYLVVELPDGTNVVLNASHSIEPATSSGTVGTYPPININTSATYTAIRTIRRGLLWDKVRKGWTIGLIFGVNAIGDGLIIRNFGVQAALLADPVTEDAFIT